MTRQEENAQFSLMVLRGCRGVYCGHDNLPPEFRAAWCAMHQLLCAVGDHLPGEVIEDLYVHAMVMVASSMPEEQARQILGDN